MLLVGCHYTSLPALGLQAHIAELNLRGMFL